MNTVLIVVYLKITYDNCVLLLLYMKLNQTLLLETVILLATCISSARTS
jgi:hypothetical protein